MYAHNYMYVHSKYIHMYMYMYRGIIGVALSIEYSSFLSQC